MYCLMFHSQMGVATLAFSNALFHFRGQRSLVEGEVVVCTAGSLPVKWVFHSVVAQPLRKVSLKNLARLDSIYTQIFHAANKLDIKSLALPLIGAGLFSCRNLYSFVVYLYVNGSGSITSVGEERAFVCCCLPVNMWFLFGEVSSSSGCLGWATLLYCGTP